MIVDINKRRKRYKWGERILYVASFATPMIASTIEFAGKVDEKAYPFMHKAFGVAKDYSLFFYALMVILLFIGYRMTRKGNTVCWEALQVQLDELHSIVFAEYQDQANDVNRVTLFQYKKWCYRRYKWNLKKIYQSIGDGKGPGTGWLIPVLRSGHISRNTNTVFHAPDESRMAEGIAGKCYVSNCIVHVEKLPAVREKSSEQNKKRYASKSHTPLALVKQYTEQGKSLPRSIMSIPVTTSSGDFWGVVVFDSQNESGINKEDTQEVFRAVTNTVGVLLEELK